MVAVPSQMLALGTQAPLFALPDTDGRIVSLDSAHGAPALLVMFLCNHCPYVKHVRHQLARIGQEYGPRGVAMFAINSNDWTKYPDDAPAAMAEEKRTVGYPFPYLADESQHVALAYQAACTPDLYLFDADKRLVYRGQLDDSRPTNDRPVTGSDLRAALDAVLAGRPVPEPQVPSIGCNIKWRPGKEPRYFSGGGSGLVV